MSAAAGVGAPGVGAGLQGPGVGSALSCGAKALPPPRTWLRALSERPALAFFHAVLSPADGSRLVPQRLPARGWTRDLKHSLSRERMSSRGLGNRSLWISLPEAVSGGLGAQSVPCSTLGFCSGPDVGAVSGSL